VGKEESEGIGGRKGGGLDKGKMRGRARGGNGGERETDGGKR